MNRAPIEEAAAVLKLTAAALRNSAGGPPMGVQGANLRQACGTLSADAFGMIRTASFGSALLAAFDAAWMAGASFDAFDRVRSAVMALTGRSIWGIVQHSTPFSDGSTFSDGTMWAEAPSVSEFPLGTSTLGAPAVVVQQACIRMALAEQARVLAATAFKSRAEIDAYAARINAVFGPAETYAADQGDAAAFRALVALHASVTQDLAMRARPLPKLIRYTFADRRPSLWLANRLYGDASRSDELVAENHPVHPLFMPATGRALSR